MESPAQNFKKYGVQFSAVQSNVGFGGDAGVLLCDPRNTQHSEPHTGKYGVGDLDLTKGFEPFETGCSLSS